MKIEELEITYVHTEVNNVKLVYYFDRVEWKEMLAIIDYNTNEIVNYGNDYSYMEGYFDCYVECK